MATSNIIPPNPLLFPTCVLAFVLPIAPQPQILSLALSVDKVNLFSFNINRAHDNAINLHALAQTKPPSPLRRPKLFIIPAKRAVVSDIFAYVARQVMMRWEWEEAREWAQLCRKSWRHTMVGRKNIPCPCHSLTVGQMPKKKFILCHVMQVSSRKPRMQMHNPNHELTIWLPQRSNNSYFRLFCTNISSVMFI